MRRQQGWKVAGIALLLCRLANAGPTKAGTITTFDVQAAGTSSGQGTFPQGINPAREITGYYVDKNNGNHGFVRATNGAITTVDAPGATGQGDLGRSN